MDYTYILKPALVTITGVFGIVGLIGDPRDKNTGVLTKWGKISLAGIVASTILSLIIQIRESAIQASQTTKASELTLQIVRNTQKSVEELHRALSPLSLGELWAEVSGDCNEPIFKEACLGIVTSNNRLTKTTDVENKRWNRAEIDVLDEEAQTSSFCKDDAPPVLSAAFISEHNATKGPVSNNNIIYRLRFGMAKDKTYSSGEISIVVDLPRKWFVYFDDGAGEYKINSLAVHTLSGEFVVLFDRKAGDLIKSCMDKYAKRRGYTHASYGRLRD